MAERSSSTKWARSRLNCSPNCCACFRVQELGGRKQSHDSSKRAADRGDEPGFGQRRESISERPLYRLSVFPIRMPPLRERREDIPLLVRYFVRKFAMRMDRHIETVPKDTVKALANWSWRGNIRELENLMER